MVRMSETAQRLVQRGHQVTVLTTVPNYPSGIIPPEYRNRPVQEEVLDGVRVIRVWSFVSANKGFLRRILSQFSFGCLAALLGWRAIGRPDLILVESHPLFNAISGRLLAWRKHCPFVFVVSDLWPESAVQLGVLRSKVLIWLAERLEWSTYQRASLVWTLSAGIRNTLIERGLNPQRVFLLTNGADTTRFYPLAKELARTELGWKDRFTVLYAGNHGLSHGLITIIDAAERLQDHPQAHFILVGDGSEKADLVAEAQKRRLSNVTFLDPLPHQRMPLALAAADICLVPMRKGPLFEGRLPLKMFEVMASARPILLGVDGEARQLAVEEAGAAIFVEPQNAGALAAAILNLWQHPEVAKILGQQGRIYVETRFDRDQLVEELDAHLAPLLERSGNVTTSKTRIIIPATPSPVRLPETPAPGSLPATPVLADAAAGKDHAMYQHYIDE
ncbi:MAG: glycosyltransferase family 4 protein [Ktedonobacteraceae bacterium]